ncbi:MAG: hypothetical protein ACRDFX_01905 [Chloroflexota bacterium]
MILLFLPARSSIAASLALAHSDYPSGSHIVVIPSTDAAADHYLSPVHRSTFETLGRLDATGWLQFATWHFRTGSGHHAKSHTTVFGYALNVFASYRVARKAIADVKLHTHTMHVAHLLARRFVASNSRHTLIFTFYRFHSVEIEAYYEYSGVAPHSVATSLKHVYSRQLSHLAHLARVYEKNPPRPSPSPTSTLQPSPTPTAIPTPISTPVATNTSVPVPTATVAATPTPAPTSTASPVPTATRAPTPTSTPVLLQVTASTQLNSQDEVVLTAMVTENGHPTAGIDVSVSFPFPSHPENCSATSGTTGQAVCSVHLPPPSGRTTVHVTVQAIGPGGITAYAYPVFTYGS